MMSIQPIIKLNSHGRCLMYGIVASLSQPLLEISAGTKSMEADDHFHLLAHIGCTCVWVKQGLGRDAREADQAHLRKPTTELEQ